MKRIFGVLVLVIFSQMISFQIRGQMRKIFLDSVDDNNHINKISLYTPSEGYIGFTKWIGYTVDSGRSFNRKYITWSNVDYNNYPVNLTLGFGISGVKAFNKDTLIAYGDYFFVPAILYSTNGGNSFKLIYHSQWNAQEFTRGIMDMAFPGNGSIGYAVEADRIIKTTNKGLSWVTVRTEPNSFFSKVQALDNNNVIALSTHWAENKLLKSIDGGNTWLEISVPGGAIKGAYFLTPLKGWVSVSDGKLYYTTDGGSSWVLINDPEVAPFNYQNINFTNDSTGYAVGILYNTYKTTDSGKIWQPLFRENNFEYLLYTHNDIFRQGDDELWAGGGHGFLEITTNGGGTPYPKAFFRIDTTNSFVTNSVNLVNHSKPNYQFKWYKNDTLISTTYHASYNHNIYHSVDTIKLIVSDGNYSDSVVKYQYFNPVIPEPPPTPFNGWILKPTGIDDNLLDVRFLGNNGILIGEQGIYYTTTGAGNPSGWKKFQISNSVADSLMLARTKFKQLSFHEQSTVFYVCGNDTVNNKAILFKLDVGSLSYAFPYVGAPGTIFNAMMNTPGQINIVGNDGLFVNYLPSSNTAFTSYLNTNKNLKSVFRRFGNSDLSNLGILSDSILFVGRVNAFSHQFEVYYSHQLNRKLLAGTSQTGWLDFEIGPNSLYFTRTTNSFLALDSIKKHEPSSLTFNGVFNSNGGTKIFVATNQGVYRVIFDPSLLGSTSGEESVEYQPTSMGKSINSIWFRQNPQYDTGYAVGPDGVLFQTLETGGPTVPYSEITTEGNCLGNATILAGHNGSGTICKWFVDGVYKGSSCTGLSTTINTTGSYTVKYIVSNQYGLTDTSYKNITISQVPSINLPTSIVDSILCKSEPAIIIISNTQQGYRYELISQSTGASFGGITGNGGQVILTSVNLSKTGNYFIRVSSINGACSRNFTNKISIKVEQTESRFLADKINITIGEQLSYYQRSPESQSFLWTFHGDASISTSSSANPSNVFYNSPGQKTVTLVSISPNGCSDTINANAVYVYNKPVPEDVCYILDIDSTPGINWQTLHHLAPGPDDGFLLTASGTAPKLNSRYGLSTDIPSNDAGYFARYTTDGALKWVDYFKAGGRILTSATDQYGNIYLTGESYVHSYFYFNNGDSMKLAASPVDTLSYLAQHNGFILKLDSNGTYLWHVVLDDPSPEYQGNPVRGGLAYQLKIQDEHIIVAGNFLANLAYWKNGIGQTLVTLPNGVSNELENNFILKITNDGTLLWHMYFENDAVNELYGLTGVEIDKAGNSYFTGYYEERLIVHDVGLVTNITYNGNVGAVSSYLVKVDSTGRLAWDVNITNGFSFRDVLMHSIAVDSIGNCYITGAASLSNESEFFIVTNSDESTDSVSVASYCLLKIDSAGIYRWGVGSGYSYYGQGNYVYLKDNHLYTLGTLSDNGQNTSSFTMSSTDGADIHMQFDASEFFVAKYDTTGALQRVVKSGLNGTGTTMPSQFFIDSKQNIIISGNIGGTGTPMVFNNPVTIEGSDGFFTKLNSGFCYSMTPPVANAGNDQPICNGSGTTIGALANGDTYSWISNPAGFTSNVSNPFVAPSVTTAYYLTVTNNAGFASRDTVIVTVLPPPTADAGADKDICPGTNTSIGSSSISGLTYNWASSPAGFSSALANPAVTPEVNTTYYLTVSNLGGCIAKDTVVVNINAVVTPSITISGTNTVIAGQSSLFTATITNGGTIPSFQWQDSTDISGWQIISGATSQTLNYTPAQTGHKIRCQLTSNENCAQPSSIYSSAVVFSVSTVTGINPAPAETFGIHLYPNPAGNILVIDSLKISDKWQRIEIVNIEGKQKLVSMPIVNQSRVQIPVKSLLSGMYMAIITNRAGRQVFLKFIKL